MEGTFKCPKCDYTETNPTKFSNHCVRKHKLDTRQLCIDFFYEGVEPTCKCGCDGKVKFHSFLRKFSEFCPGHQSRVKNNWGHNEKALKKSHASRRKSFDEGKWSAWNKDETKETNERVAAYGQKQSENFTPERRQERSKRMTKNRLNGTVQTLWGPDHPQWRGGTSTITQRIRGNSRFYAEWKFPKLKAADFTCTQCGSSDELCVHHDEQRMSDIIREVMEQEKYDPTSDDLKQAARIVNAITDHHLEHSISGVVLCKVCHQKEHPNLNL